MNSWVYLSIVFLFIFAESALISGIPGILKLVINPFLYLMTSWGDLVEFFNAIVPASCKVLSLPYSSWSFYSLRLNAINLF
jgi:hypothetical protein